MGFDRIRIKSNARLFYKNNTGTSICAVLIYFGVYYGAVIVTYNLAAVLAGLGLAAGRVTGAGAAASDAFYSVTYVLSMVLGVAVMPLTMGLQNWYRLTIYRKASLTEIFSMYTNGRFWGAIGMQLLMSLYIWLWSLLFIVPGIIKSYSYSQAMFIKAENPNISASRAIELSQIMMNGHKMDLCVLHFSFFGWQLLSVLTLNILGVVYVYPYFYAALAFAYEEIKMDAASRGVIDLAEISQPAMENAGF